MFSTRMTYNPDDRKKSYGIMSIPDDIIATYHAVYRINTLKMYPHIDYTNYLPATVHDLNGIAKRYHPK